MITDNLKDQRESALICVICVLTPDRLGSGSPT
jgi:hypothetical protein